MSMKNENVDEMDMSWKKWLLDVKDRWLFVPNFLPQIGKNSSFCSKIIDPRHCKNLQNVLALTIFSMYTVYKYNPC